MCWSPEVTFVFVAIELAASAVLYRQGKAWFLLVSSGVVLQEVLQLLLWYQIERDEASPSNPPSCSAANTLLSLLEEVVVIGWVPYAWCVSSQIECKRDVRLAEELVASERFRTQADPVATAAATDWLNRVRYSCARAWQFARITKAGLTYFTVATVTYTLYGMAAGYFDGGVSSAAAVRGFCTTRGPIGGHQLWPFMDMPLPPSVRGWVKRAGAWAGFERVVVPSTLHFRAMGGGVGNGNGDGDDVSGGGIPVERAATVLFQLGLGVLYLALLSISMSLVRGRFDTINSEYRQGWLPMGVTMALGPLLIGMLWLIIGGEYGSVWCWTASGAFLLMLAEPAISRLLQARSKSESGAWSPIPGGGTIGMGPVLLSLSRSLCFALGE
jgi:hypothetical protein